jgi:hypothetical protein
MDFEVDVGEWEYQNHAATLAGDLTTARSMLQVWTEANGPKVLYRAEVKNVSGADLYAALYAVNAPGPTSKLLASRLVAAGASVDWNFGMQAGVSPYQQDADGTAHKGCVLQGQSAVTVAGAATSANAFNIRALYKV